MTRPIIQIGDDAREMTDDEFAQYEKDQTEFAEIQAAAKAKKQARAAVLAKLGLTADEAAALLG